MNGLLMNTFPAQHRFRQEQGVTLIELLISLVIATLLFAGLNSVMGGVLRSQEYMTAHTALVRDAEFAMDRMLRSVGGSRLLLLPLADKPGSDWPDNIREQTVPASAPVGSSIQATAVLSVTLPASSDLDFDGFPDADNDRDGRIDEDAPDDKNYDYASGIYLIDDAGDGYVDEGNFTQGDDDEWLFTQNEDPLNGLDDDNDGTVDEDPPDDMNADGCPGLCGVDDDGDGLIDEGGQVGDDDEDGQLDEDWYDALVYYLDGGELKERIPVPWDESGAGGISGRDFIVSTIAENVSRFRVERLPASVGQAQLVDITLELTTQEAGTVAVQTTVRIGGAL